MQQECHFTRWTSEENHEECKHTSNTSISLKKMNWGAEMVKGVDDKKKVFLSIKLGLAVERGPFEAQNEAWSN